MQDNILGEFVRRTMNEKRLSSYEVSERSGRSISPSSVNKIIMLLTERELYTLLSGPAIRDERLGDLIGLRLQLPHD